MIVLKMCAFLKRDYLIESSYRLTFVFEILAAVFPVFVFYFISKLVAQGHHSGLAIYGGSYFPFAVVGLALSQYFIFALNTFAASIQRSQCTGCLEATLSTQTSPCAIIFFSSLYAFTTKTIHLAMIIAVAGLFLGVDFGHASISATFLTLVVTLVIFSGLGLFSAAITLVLKRNDIVEWLMGTASSLLSGAFYPIDLMPRWMQDISQCLPMTYCIRAMRLAILSVYSPVMLWDQLLLLAGVGAATLSCSLWFLNWAVEKGRREGTLMHY